MKSMQIDEVDVDEAIHDYRLALASIKCDVDGKKWQHLQHNSLEFIEATAALRARVEGRHLAAYEQEELQQLSIWHRRVVRQIQQQMLHVSEDLQSVEKGLRQVQYVANHMSLS